MEHGVLSKVEEYPMNERVTGRYGGEERRWSRKEGKKYTHLLKSVYTI